MLSSCTFRPASGMHLVPQSAVTNPGSKRNVKTMKTALLDVSLDGASRSQSYACLQDRILSSQRTCDKEALLVEDLNRSGEVIHEPQEAMREDVYH